MQKLSVSISEIHDLLYVSKELGDFRIVLSDGDEELIQRFSLDILNLDVLYCTIDDTVYLVLASENIRDDVIFSIVETKMSISEFSLRLLKAESVDY